MNFDLKGFLMLHGNEKNRLGMFISECETSTGSQKLYQSTKISKKIVLKHFKSFENTLIVSAR